MVEQLRNDLTPQIEAHKSKLLALQEQIDAQKGILEEEKGKKAKADRAKIEAASQRLSSLAEQMDLLNTENSTLNRLAKRSPMGSGVMSEVNGLFNVQDNQIDLLLADAATILEAIPGVKTAAEAQRMVDTLSVLENPDATEAMVVYLHEQVQVLTQQILELRQQMAGRVPAATPEAAQAAAPAEVTTPQPAPGEVVAPAFVEGEDSTASEADDDFFPGLRELGAKAMDRFRSLMPKRATLEERQMKKAEGALKHVLGENFDALIGILENPEVPAKRAALLQREAVLIPILAVLEEDHIIELTAEAKELVKGYNDEYRQLTKELVGRYEGDDPALSSLQMWARLNIHRFNKLPEVVAGTPAPVVEPATTTVPAADGGTSEAGGNPTVVTSPTDIVTGVTDVNRRSTNLAGDAAPGPNQELAGDGKAAAPAETTVKNETDAKKKLKGLYTRVRSRVPESADDATKLNAVTTREYGRAALLGEAIRNFTAVVDGNETKFDDNSADMQTQMLLLIVMSEVKSAYDRLNPKPKTTMAELKALVSKIAS